MINELKYPLGFLLTKNKFTNKYNWSEYYLDDDWILYYDKRNEFECVKSGTTQIVTLGYFLDIRNGQLNRSSIINTLINSRKNSYEEFLDELSYLNGRYLIILIHNGEILLFNDTAGLRTVCFHMKEPVIASHDTLIDEVLNNQLEQLYTNPQQISFSNYTRFKDVYKLIPNMHLNIETKDMIRYYPLSEFEPKSKEEIKKELKEYFNETVKWLKNTDYNKLLSITGGGDSRMSLAILKSIINDIETFTYLRDTSQSSEFVKKTYKFDQEIVSSIVDNLNLNHKFIYISDKTEINQNFIETVKHNSFSVHSRNLAYDYYKIYGNKNYLHIRSTAIFNIGKYIFPKRSLKIKEWDFKSIAHFLGRWTNIEDEDKSAEYIEYLMEKAQIKNFYNYNPLELLFLSYRLIQWHSGVVGESDIAFNTMILLNARKIVDLLLSYPASDRAENKLYYDLINDLWPILNYWSINDTVTIKDKYEQLIKEQTKVLESKEQQATREKEIKMKKNIEISDINLEDLIESRTTQSAGLVCTPYENGLYYQFQKNIRNKDYYLLRLKLSEVGKVKSVKFNLKFDSEDRKPGEVIVSSDILDGEVDVTDLEDNLEFLVEGYDLKKDINIKVQHKKVVDENDKGCKIWIGNLELMN